ncbi:MAG: hypothetical protein ABH867_02440 [Patescibacteria group bacterium]|nr:hypothetical protein [Patescibacteria group bacterium]
MITKGVSDIRGIRSINTRPGPITESSGLLKLYQLAAEKDNLLEKVKWVERQKTRVMKRLSEIARGMNMMKRVVEERSKRESPPAGGLNSNSGFRGMSIKY